jgi:hypothetical protein
MRVDRCCLGQYFCASTTESNIFYRSIIEAGLERNREFLGAKQRLAEAQGLLRQAGVRAAPTFEVEGNAKIQLTPTIQVVY